MDSVTSRISKIKQPRGGYIKPSEFDCIVLEDDRSLSETENIHASLIGMVVDYLTRYLGGASVKEAFHISLMGASRAEDLGVKDSLTIATYFAVSIEKSKRKLTDEAIICACKLVSFDVWLRNPSQAKLARKYGEISPDSQTINNIRIMVERSISFFENYGPVIADGFSFSPKDIDDADKMDFVARCISGKKAVCGGYTNTVMSGDGDFLTSDTMWDFKVSKTKPNNKHTLQLLMYWIMGLHSGREEFKEIQFLGIFNPRRNEVYLYDTVNVSKELVETIEKEVICY